jgi:hypothetical protein
LTDGPELKKWVEGKLDQRKQKPGPDGLPPEIDLKRFVRYDQKAGLYVVVQQAFSLASKRRRFVTETLI